MSRLRESYSGCALSVAGNLSAPVPSPVRNFLQSLTATRHHRRPAHQWAMSDEVILQPGQWRNTSDADISGRVSIRLSEEWEKCSGYSVTGGRWGAVWGEARRGRGRGGWGEARWAPSLQTSWPSTRSPVTWDSWTERTCTFSFRWVRRFPSFYN